MTKYPRLALAAVAALVLILTTPARQAAAQNAPYRFDLLAERPHVGPSVRGVRVLPALNDAGTAAFSLPRTGSNFDEIIYSGTPGNTREVATPGLFVGGGLSINNPGRIALIGGDAATPASGPGLYAVTPGGPVVPIAYGNFVDHYETAISDNGSAIALTDAPMFLPSTVVMGDGTAPAQVVFTTRDPFPIGGIHTYNTQLLRPRMNAAGDWVVSELGQTVTFYSAIHDRHTSRYAGGTNSPVSGEFIGIGAADVAGNDVLLFQGTRFNDTSSHLFKSINGAAAVPVPGSEGLPGSYVALNDGGEIALLDGGTGEDAGTRLRLFRDGALQNVLAQGDPLLGSTVSTIGFDPKGFNNANQFALLVGLADGRDVYVLASPVPEPAAVAMLVALGGALSLRRRARR